MRFKRPNRLKLSRSQFEILVVLSEAGSENLPTLLNCVTARHKTPSLRQTSEATDSLVSLAEIGLVCVQRSFNDPTALDAGDWVPHIGLASASNTWVWNKLDGGPFPEVVLQQRGFEALQR